ncbi:hypothetical protein [Agromyces sp. SYSU T00266]|uniref:hypothetical protein n=1 Tax=Agromyces zhanjiangensis TaxID=3158562 RepID=UPI003391DD34
MYPVTRQVSEGAGVRVKELARINCHRYFNENVGALDDRMWASRAGAIQACDGGRRAWPSGRISDSDSDVIRVDPERVNAEAEPPGSYAISERRAGSVERCIGAGRIGSLCLCLGLRGRFAGRSS